jgi:DNA repair exonuclease SbcCD ATPase subunit
MTLSEIKKHYERQVGKKEQLEKDISVLQIEIKTERKRAKHLEKANEIVKLVGAETQAQLQFHISDITSLALEGVFTNPYKLVTEFVERRGKMECDLLFERNASSIKPKNASGFGAMDIASLALRIACWSMQMPRTRNTILLDEPFKHLSEDNQEAASQMLKELSTKLGIQFIVITHVSTLSAYADRVFKVSINKKGISKITQL